MSESIIVEYDLPHAPEKVWRALTEPSLLAAWLMENDIAPIVGHRFTLRAQPMPGWDGIVRCEVLEAEAPKRLRYTWLGGTAENKLDTVVSWTLTPTANGTRLLLEHAGFLPANAFAFDALGRGWRGKVAERMSDALTKLG